MLPTSGGQGGQGGSGGKGGKPPVPPVSNKTTSSALEARKAQEARMQEVASVTSPRGNRASIAAASAATREEMARRVNTLAAVSEDDAGSEEGKRLTRFARLLQQAKTTASASFEPVREYLATCCVEDEMKTGEKIKEEDVPKEFWDRLEGKRRELKGKKVAATLGGAGVRMSLAQRLQGANDVLNAGASAAEKTRGNGTPERDVAFYRYLFGVVAHDLVNRTGSGLEKLRAAIGKSDFGRRASAVGSAVGATLEGAAKGLVRTASAGAQEMKARLRRGSTDEVDSDTTVRGRSGSTVSNSGQSKPVVGSPTNAARVSLRPTESGAGVNQVKRPINKYTIVAKSAAARVEGNVSGSAHTSNAHEANKLAREEAARAAAEHVRTNVKPAAQPQGKQMEERGRQAQKRRDTPPPVPPRPNTSPKGKKGSR